MLARVYDKQQVSVQTDVKKIQKSTSSEARNMVIWPTLLSSTLLLSNARKWNRAHRDILRVSGSVKTLNDDAASPAGITQNLIARHSFSLGVTSDEMRELEACLYLLNPSQQPTCVARHTGTKEEPHACKVSFHCARLRFMSGAGLMWLDSRMLR